MWGYQHPLVGERVQPAMRIFGEAQANRLQSYGLRRLANNVRESLQGAINATKNGNLTESRSRPILASGVIAYMLIISHP
jgi:hypothetical protein